MIFSNLFRNKKELEKPAEVKTPEKRFVLKFKPLAPFNVGRTAVKITFQDGREFTKYVYGYFHQHISYGEDIGSYNRTYRPPFAGEAVAVKSGSVAESYIKDSNLGGGEYTYVDDEKAPLHSYIGRAIEAKILDSEDYFEDHQEAYVEEEV